MTEQLPQSPTGSLAGLASIAQALRSAYGNRELLALVTREAMTAMNADQASLQEWSESEGTWTTLVNVGLLTPEMEPFPKSERYRAEDFPELVGALRAGGYVTSLDDPSDATNAALHEILRAEGMHSSMSVPLLHRGTFWGELYLTRTAERPSFNRSDLELARVASSQVAAAVAHVDRIDEFRKLAYKDGLTGLSNRRALEEALDDAVLHHIANGTAVAVMVADVNGLKKTNDSLGHEAGDRLLIMCAEDLSSTFSEVPGALLARMGGDEFCAVLSGPAADLMPELAARFAASVSDHSPDGISYGLASSSETLLRITSGKDLLRAADAAQYRFKRLSRPAGAADENHRTPTRSADPTSLGLAEIVAAIERLNGGATLPRLASVADLIARRYDAAAWFISVESHRTIYTLDGVVLRQDKARHANFVKYFNQPEGYPLADYPLSARAIDGATTITRLGDPQAHESELALLLVGGFQHQILTGGRNRDGGWLVELFGDERTAPPESYANLARAGVAMALVGTGARLEATLLDRVGGESVLRSAVEVMDSYVSADPILARRFEGVDLTYLVDAKVKFIAALLGGTEAYRARGVGDAHHAMHITNHEFRVFLSHLERALRTLGVEPEVTTAVADRISQLAPIIAPGQREDDTNSASPRDGWARA